MKRPLIIYFALAYFISWIVFVMLALNRHGIIFLFPVDAAHERIGDLWHSLAPLGPALAAIITLKIFYGKKYITAFLKSYSVKGISAFGWFLAFSPLLYLIFGILVDRIINGQWFSLADYFRDNHLLTPFHLLAWVLPSFTYGIFEEVGWRGFALPYLQMKYSALAAATIVSLFWFGWHIPSFFYRYETNVPMLFGMFFGIWAGSVYLTYVFNYTKGSLLVVSIWHIVWDIVSIIGKEGMIAAIMSALIIVLGLYVVIRYKGKNLSPSPKITMDL